MTDHPGHPNLRVMTAVAPSDIHFGCVSSKTRPTPLRCLPTLLILPHKLWMSLVTLNTDWWLINFCAMLAPQWYRCQNGLSLNNRCDFAGAKCEDCQLGKCEQILLLWVRMWGLQSDRMKRDSKRSWFSVHSAAHGTPYFWRPIPLLHLSSTRAPLDDIGNMSGPKRLSFVF